MVAREGDPWEDALNRGETHGAPRVVVIVLNYDGLAHTLRCLESLERLDYPNHEIMVVDNGSREPVAAAIAARFPSCRVLRLAENRGWAGGNNAGLQEALRRGAEFVLLLNNDTVVAPDLLRLLVEAALGDPRYGILGPVVHWMEAPDQVMTAGFQYSPLGSTVFQPATRAAAGSEALVPVDLVNGCCLLISRPVLESAGRIDERFFLVHEESDYCLRAARRGFRCGILPRTLIWHLGHGSYRRDAQADPAYYNARNLWLLLRKHPCGSPAALLRAYLTQVHYQYDLARERDDRAGGEAVAAGLADMLQGRRGQRPPDHDLVAILATGFLETLRLGVALRNRLRPTRRTKALR